MDAETRFRQMFATAYPALRRYAHHRGLSGADADDLVAEVLTIAWRRLDAVPEDDALPWLFAVARNVRRNDLRRAERRRLLGERVRGSRDLTTAAYEPTDVDGTHIRAALAALREDERELLVLIGWDGLTPTQAASVLGCSASTLRVRLHRARNRFAEQLEARATQPPAPTVRRRDPQPQEVHDGI